LLTSTQLSITAANLWQHEKRSPRSACRKRAMMRE
jgi:hypothetical protein